MNNFNKVFTSVKQNCTETSDHASFETICGEVNMERDRLEFYINCLSEAGLVAYCKERQIVSLTKTGKVSDKIFMY